jgi:ABC-type phosphate/phosphonate transport system ATPase subunit
VGQSKDGETKRIGDMINLQFGRPLTGRLCKRNLELQSWRLFRDKAYYLHFEIKEEVKILKSCFTQTQRASGGGQHAVAPARREVRHVHRQGQ